MAEVSIIVPCYNQAKFLEECLQSVLNQSFKDWECIIVNDGSTDNTQEVSLKWILLDKRFKYLCIENRGVSVARNYGIENSISKWILPLDADDVIGENYLEFASKEFNKDFLLIYCNAVFFGEKQGKWNLPKYSLKNLAQDNIIFCAAFFKKESWKKIGGYDLNMKEGLEDWEFWISLLKNGGKVLKLDYVGFYYRIKGNSRQSNLNSKLNSKIKIFEYLSYKHTDFFVSQFGSFHQINSQKLKLESINNNLSSNNKYLIDRLLYNLFNFKIFNSKF